MCFRFMVSCLFDFDFGFRVGLRVDFDFGGGWVFGAVGGGAAVVGWGWLGI